MSTTIIAPKRNQTPHHPKLNLRLVVLALVVLAPLGWMTYTLVSQSISEGIEQVGAYKEVNLKALGNFPFDDLSDTEAAVPPVYRALDGQKVLLIGQMYSDMVASNTTDRFQLVYSIANCCFGGPPKVQERVFAKAPEGKRVFVYDHLAKVYGTLHVRAVRENGKVVSLFDMDVEKIEKWR